MAPNQQNSSQRRGAFFCAGFIALEAIQSVYFGGLFQTTDSFLIGSATFGIGCAVCLAAAAILDAGQFAVAWRLRGLLAKAGLATAIGWLTYFMALQLLEPAVTYTVFSGAIPITVALAAQFGVATATRPAGRLSLAGHVLLAGALVFLCAAAIGGFTGFDRGGMLGSVGGVVAVLTSAVAISWALFYCRQMTRLGLGPNLQFGLRCLPYVAVSAIAAFLRIDAKQPVPLGREILAILAGQVLITLPSYFAQRAVALVTPLAVGVAGALGPFLVFGLQALEGRVAFSTRTLAGLIAYSLGSLIIAVGELMPGRPRHSALPSA